MKDSIQKNLNENQSGHLGSISKENENGIVISSSKMVGKVLERYEVQVCIVILLYMDIITTIITMIVSSEQMIIRNSSIMEREISNGDSIYLYSLLKLLSSFSSFTLFCFCLEIIGLLYAFGTSFFSHLGYTTDLVILLFIFYQDISSLESWFPLRLLGFLRVWRIARLVITIIDGIQFKYDQVKSKLSKTESQVSKLRRRIEQMKELETGEKKVKKQMELTLDMYKEEVATLKEALKIAAMDVAGAAEEEFAVQRKMLNESRKEKYVDTEGDEFYDGFEVTDETDRRIIVHDDGRIELD